MAKPALGSRVTLKREVVRPTYFTLPPGMEGTVSYITSSLVVVKMDKPFVGGDQWEHEVYWTDGITVWEDDLAVSAERAKP